ncbi:insulinase family protein, partial [candidate division KSB1 bacterium]|nr:insulinase family protein [candidate division KSB1 bacterium]
WLSAPSLAPGDGELDLLSSILAGGLNSRLYKRLVYELQVAQDVTAFQRSGRLSSSFVIFATARSGHTLAELEKVIQEEIDKMKNDAPSDRELQRAVNQYEAMFLRQLESVGAKADLLNNYFMLAGNPDYFNEDLARYKALEPKDVQAAAQTYLRDNGRVVLSIVPQGKKELAAAKAMD